MARRPALLAVVLLGVLGSAGVAQAQLFGERTLGRPFSRRSKQSSYAASRLFRTTGPAPRTIGEMGSSDPSARYRRGNRRATDFVGADSAEARDFVGVQRSDRDAKMQYSVSDRYIERAGNVNRTGAPANSQETSLDPPQLSVGFAFTSRTSNQVSLEARSTLESTLSLDESSSVEVSVEGATATLRGEVASERHRRLAGLLVLFEPGIDRVQNELTVKVAIPARGVTRTPQVPTGSPP